MNPVEPTPTRLARNAALIAGALGWVWGLVLILSVFPSFLSRFDNQEPYPVGKLGDAFATVKPVDRDLLGPLADRARGRSVCDKMWFDRDDGALIRGVGPSNGSSAPAWLTLTVGSHVVVARVTVDLWNGVGAGTGSLESSTSFIVATNLRVIERLPPPPPGPPGWRVIRPGECVLGNTEPQDALGVIGRFLVDLPGQRSVGIEFMPEANGRYIPMTENLMLDGYDLSRSVDGERYRTARGGRYELVVRRTDNPDAAQPPGTRMQRYTISVAWGAPITSACAPPDPDSNCFQEVQP